jgi:hypothetical protein
LVLDSLESLAGHMKKDQWRALLDAMVEAIVESNKTSDDPVTRLMIGAGSATPDFGATDKRPAKPRAKGGYAADSVLQYGWHTFEAAQKPIPHKTAAQRSGVGARPALEAR